MTQDDDIVAHAGPLADLINWCVEHFWFICAGLLSVVLWGVLASLLELRYDAAKSCWLSAIFVVAFCAVVFCLFANDALVGDVEDEPEKKP